MKDWVYYIIIFFAAIALILKPLLVLVADEVFSFAVQLAKYIERDDIINLCKIILGGSLFLAVGYFVGDYFVSGEILNDVNKFYGLKYFANLFLIILGFPTVLALILFWLIVTVGSGYNGIMNKLEQTRSPEPGSCVGFLFWILLFLYFVTILICSLIINRK
jgi:hypothetical protein